MDAKSVQSNEELIDIRFDSSQQSETRILELMKRAIGRGVEYYFTVDPDQTQHFIMDASPDDMWFVLGGKPKDFFVDETDVLQMRKLKMAISPPWITKQKKPYKKSKLSSGFA